MQPTPFKQVDVFTQVPFRGNAVAVVLDASGLDTGEMQRIANWTNLSETTFVLPPSTAAADYCVRIFTPRSELPFAGHPTIGTAYALLEAGLVRPHAGALVQECGAGLIRLQVDYIDGLPSIAFELPRPTVTALNDAQIDELESILGAPVLRAARPRLIDVGIRWIVAQLHDVQALLALRPDMARMSVQDTQFATAGVVGFAVYPEDGVAQVEVRAFAPSCGVDEDPVCGSGNGCVGAFIRETGQSARLGSNYLSSQGQIVGRSGRIRVSIEPTSIRVGGHAVTCIDGVLNG